MLNLH
jgi:hypothetical protein